MCVDCVLASPRIAQVDPGDEPLPDVVLSQIQHGTSPNFTPLSTLFIILCYVVNGFLGLFELQLHI
jgi:hypothetical protein